MNDELINILILAKSSLLRLFINLDTELRCIDYYCNIADKYDSYLVMLEKLDSQINSDIEKLRVDQQGDLL